MRSDRSQASLWGWLAASLRHEWERSPRPCKELVYAREKGPREKGHQV